MSRRTNESLLDHTQRNVPAEPVRNRVLVAGILALGICVVAGLYAAGVVS